MRRSRDRIITTHVGSLSRPAELLTLNKARAAGADVAAYATGVAAVPGPYDAAFTDGMEIAADHERYAARHGRHRSD